PLNANGRVSVSNVNGSITIETWDNPQVKLEAVKIADSKERLTEVEIKIDARQDSFSVETDYENMRSRNGDKSRNNGKLQVEFHLIVPRGAILDEIETVNGSISISNAVNTTKASAVNGEVKATNLRGTANLSTVNGTVEADFEQLQAGSRISLNTVNGTVNLTIPSDANATIKADSLNGNISNDFGLPMRKGQYIGRNLYGRIGSGDVQIKLNSVNGGLSIRRKNDGKNPSPAINLLPAKNNDDFDGDYDANIKRTIKNTNKTIVKSEREIGEAISGAIIEGVTKVTTDSIKTVMDATNEKMQAKIKEAQQKALARMSDVSWIVDSPKIEKKSDSFAVKGIPKVTVEAENSAVSVRGWDKSEVQYFVSKISRNQNQTPLEFAAEQNGSDINIINIKVINKDEANRFNEPNRVRVEVFVPKKSNLKIVTSGEIRLEGVSGEIELIGEDGALNVRDADGKLRLTAADGRIRVIGFRGEISAQTADGDMNLEGDFQKLFAHTEDGTIILTLLENVNATLSSNKRINVEGITLTETSENNWRIGKGGTNYQLQTTDGQIFVRPANIIKTN
ncbi:MAG: hypothetical protein H0W58_17245, partial [Acidobacteria bacterium]|nr:hypothetical protein [Acidobacteriota bacterium]